VRKEFVLLTVAVATVCAVVGQPARAMNWGVCGHPNVQDAYNAVPLSAQMSLITGLGANWYRCDVAEDHYNPNPSYYQTLLNTAASNGVTILPILSPINGCWSNASVSQIKSDSYNYGYTVAKAFGSKVNYYELDNELDSWALSNSGSDGYATSSYDSTKITRAYTEVSSMAQGIKAANPNAKVMVNGTWVHIGYIQSLINKGFKFDMLAWHWYSDMGDITSVGQYGNYWNTLTSFGKPVWITESNYRNTSDLDPNEATYLNSTATQFKNLGAAAFFEYELLDEPYFNSSESWYGLCTLTASGSSWVLGSAKPAYSAYMAAITGSATHIANGTYTLTPLCATGSRLDASGAGTTNGTPTLIWQASGGSNQKWIFTDMGNSLYKIQPSYATGLALDVTGGSTADGTVVELWADNGGTNQRWIPTPVNGGYTFTPQCSVGSRLDVNGAGSTNGTTVQIWQANASSAQTWAVGSN
jgi:hypothetical protein